MNGYVINRTIKRGEHNVSCIISPIYIAVVSSLLSSRAMGRDLEYNDYYVVIVRLQMICSVNCVSFPVSFTVTRNTVDRSDIANFLGILPNLFNRTISLSSPIIVSFCDNSDLHIYS